MFFAEKKIFVKKKLFGQKNLYLVQKIGTLAAAVAAGGGAAENISPPNESQTYCGSIEPKTSPPSAPNPELWIFEKYLHIYRQKINNCNNYAIIIQIFC